MYDVDTNLSLLSTYADLLKPTVMSHGRNRKVRQHQRHDVRTRLYSDP